MVSSQRSSIAHSAEKIAATTRMASGFCIVVASIGFRGGLPIGLHDRRCYGRRHRRRRLEARSFDCLFLASELCGARTGYVLAVAGARMYAFKVVETPGKFKEGESTVWTANEIAENWDAIVKA